MTTETAAPPASASIEGEMQSTTIALRDQGKLLAITTPAHYEQAAIHLAKLKGQMKRVADWFKPMKQSADQAKKVLLEKEKSLIAPLEECEFAIKTAMLTYTQVEAAKRLAEQRELQRQADLRATEDRQRIQAEASRIKAQEDAARAKAEEARKAAEDSTGAERTRKLAMAERADLKAALAAEERQAVAESAAQVTAPVVHIATPIAATKGVTMRATWKHQVIDAALVPDQFKVIDEKKLAAYAKAMGAQAQVAGVRFYTEQSIASRAS